VRTREELRTVLGLAAEGVSRYEISRRTRIPPTTVLRWIETGGPRFARPDAATCPACGGAGHDDLDAPAYCHLLGLYLGDGHIAAFPRTHCLRVYLDQRYPGIVRGCARSMAAVAPRNRVAVHQRTGCVVVQCYSSAWPCLFPQHGAGAKHERTIELAPWQLDLTRCHPRELVRGLIESDGSRHLNRVRRRGRPYAYSRYTFSNRSDHIRAIFCAHLDLLDIPWRQSNAVTISVARREAVAALDEFVGRSADMGGRLSSR
jgi:hypothetical protein